jgi:hypothetical protein
MKPAMDQQERRRTQIQPLSCVDHHFGCSLTNPCVAAISVYLHLQQEEILKQLRAPRLGGKQYLLSKSK